MKFYKIYILLTIVSVALFSCRDKEDDEPPVPVSDRTVLVYMVADNSLGTQSSDLSDIKEMLVAAQNGDFDNSRLLVYRSTHDVDPTMFEITPQGKVTVKDYDNSLPSVSYARMKTVIADAKAAAPAKAYGLILWGHGSGWLQNGVEEPELAPLSFGGDSRSRWMNVTTLREAVHGENFDWIYFDCCHMASVEVAYELRDETGFIIGSVTELPGDGMPYDKNLACLMPLDSNLEQACRNTYELYDKQFGHNRTCTMSLIRTAGLERLAAVTREVMEAGTDLPSNYRPQKFMTGETCYYFDLENYISALIPDGSPLAPEFASALGSTVIYKASTPYLWNIIALKNHCGLSAFILKDAASAFDRNNYNQLQWWKDVVSYRFK